MSPKIPRAELRRTLRERAVDGPPLLVAGAPGAGKSTLLALVAEDLRAKGESPVHLHLLLAASSPEGLVRSFADALPASCLGAGHPAALTLRVRAESPADREGAFGALLRVLAELDSCGESRVVLLLDEPTEIQSLSTFTGLRDVTDRLGAALARRRCGAILTTSFPTRAAAFWSGEVLKLPLLSPGELQPLAGAAADALARASGGLPRYAVPLLERVQQGWGVSEAWAAEMADGGRLDQLCRQVYETLLLRSRGYGMSKAVLAAVARDEGCNLTAVTRHLGRSPGAVGDYLGWLRDVDALRCERKRYFFVDPVLKDWLRLRDGGVSPDGAALREAAVARVGAETTRATRDDALMEID